MPHRALIVCNWEYKDPEGVFIPLKGPRNDMTVMESALTHAQYGLFEVEKRSNLTWGELRTTFASFLDTAKPDDNLLLYFSGHGDRLQDGRLALCGVDTSSNRGVFAAMSFDTKDLREWIENGNRAPSTLVVLDCCYAGAMKGGLTDAVITDSLGSGVMVLSGGGNEPLKDANEPDEPSPFTTALIEILLDPELDGDASGMVTVDDVFDKLRKRDPPLRPPPRRNVQSQGTFALARRVLRADQHRPALKGWQELEVDVVTLRFEGATVTAAGPQPDETDTIELAGFDDHRQAAIRRLSQLADAILSASDYGDDDLAQRAVRRAWNCVGTNLFETALPSALRERIRTLAEQPPSKRLLKLQLSFADAPELRALELFPWEHLHRELDVGGGPETRGPEPIALETGLLLERVIQTELPGTLESVIEGPTTVGLVSSLRDRFDEAAGRITDGLTSMADIEPLFVSRGSDARWGDFLDAIDQLPDVLVVFAPVRRRPQGVEIGFWSDDPADADWHPAKDLVEQFRRRTTRFKAIVLVTFASRPGRDSVRATAEIARTLAEGEVGPVVFICHAPGYAGLVPAGQDSFPVLFLDALTRAERFDQAVYYAKNRVVEHGSLEARDTFGVPGCYVYERDEAESAEPKPAGQSTLSRSATLRSASPTVDRKARK